MPRLVNRELQVRDLNGLIERGGRMLGLLYGRRRVGKTFLLTHAWGNGTDLLYFTASATSPEINRRALLRAACDWAEVELREEDYPTWRTVFQTIFELRPGTPIVVVLDEFQYLATSEEGLREVASELNAVWEGQVRRGAPLVVVLSGSVVHTMEALEAGGSPLFGRLDWRCRLMPFDYRNAGRMVEAYGPRDRILAYAAFGGTPTYLDAVDDDRPLAENIIELLLSSDGRVRIQVETALEQEEGLRDVLKYRSILASVGLKRRTIGDIASALGQESDTPLKRMVKRLVALEYLEEGRNFGASPSEAKRYRIADPAQRFYYGMVLPFESAIASTGPERVWKERLEQEVWPTYVGQEVFEHVVRQTYRWKSDVDGSLPAVEEWGRWEGLDRDREPVELDVVTRLFDGRMLIGEAKFRNRPAGARVFLDLLHDLERLARSGQAWARESSEESEHPFLFVSVGGFKDSFHEVRNESPERPVISWTLDDLF